MVHRAALIGKDIITPQKSSVKLNKRIYNIVSILQNVLKENTSLTAWKVWRIISRIISEY